MKKPGIRGDAALFVCVGLVCIIARAQSPSSLKVTEACRSINADALSLRNQAKLAESEKVIRQTLAQDSFRDDTACAFTLLHNLAVVLSADGRDTEATAAAEHSLHLLKKLTRPDDPVRLFPLNTLWSLYGDQGRVAKARQIYQQLSALRPESPVDLAIFLTVAGGQSAIDGQYADAEKNYLAAIAAWQTAGKANSVEEALLLGSLAGFYLEQNRLADAEARIDQSAAIIKSAQGAVPVDVIRIYDQQAVIYARQHRWDAARVKLEEIIELSEKTRLDPSLLKVLLTNYACALRRDHRRKEAHAIAARASAIRVAWPSNALVDISEFNRAKAERKQSQ